MKPLKIRVFELSKLILLIRNNSLLVVLCVLVGMLLGAIFWLTSPPIYQITSSIQVDNSDTNANYQVADKVLDDNNQPIFTNNAPVSEKSMVYLTLPYILDPVIDSLHLDIEIQPKLFPVIGKYMFYKHLRQKKSGLESSPFWVNRNSGYSWGGERLEIPFFSVPDNMYEKPYTIKVLDSKHYLLLNKQTIVLTGVVGELARSQDGHLQIRVDEIKAHPGTIFSVNKRDVINVEKSLAQRLKINEIVKTKKDGNLTTGIIEIDLAGPDPSLAKEVVAELINTLIEKSRTSKLAKINATLNFINNELPNAKEKLAKSEKILSLFKEKNHLTVLDEQETSLLKNISDLDQQITNNKVTLAALQGEYGPKHPVIKSLLSQQTDLYSRKQMLTTELTKFPGKEVALIKLKADLELNQQLVAKLESKQQELLLTASGQISPISILDYPDVPELPESSHGKMIILTSSILGFIVSIFIILGVWMSRKNPDPFIMEERFEIPVFAIIRYVKYKNKIKGLPFKEQLKLNSLHSIQANRDFKILTAGILASQKNNRIFQFFSTWAGQGSTFIAFNCAFFLSRQKQKVLMITVGTEDNFFTNKNSKDEEYQINNNLRTIWLDYNDNAFEIKTKIQQIIDASENYDIILIDLPNIYLDAVLATNLLFSEQRFLVTSPYQSIRTLTTAIRLLTINNIEITAAVFNYTKKMIIHDIYSKVL